MRLIATMSRHFIIGTAGHVDHGKTSLIGALTGIDTDQLPEEKARGLSIDLGFAHLKLKSGEVLGIVDVPGHSRFLKNMLAGAGGIDLALLVIDAREGPRAQTGEHLTILELFQVKAGIVVLTKADLLAPEELEASRGVARAFVKGSFLEGAPLLEVSSVTGKGLDHLVAAIEKMIQELPPRDTQAPFRLPVDRVFTKPGYGVVVTGTLLSGTVRKGDRVQLLPRGGEGRIRSLQVYGGEVPEAYAGQRVAVNLAGIEPGDLQRRGSWLLPPGLTSGVRLLEGKVTFLKCTTEEMRGVFPIRDRSLLKVYLGTAEIPGRILFLDRKEGAPGEICYAQILLDEPVVAFFKDPFILRIPSPPFLAGGGTVLETASTPKKTRRSQGAEEAQYLQGKEEENLSAVVEQIFLHNPWLLLDHEGVMREVQRPLEEVSKGLEAMVEGGRLRKTRKGKYLFLPSLEAAGSQIKNALLELHSSVPWRALWKKEELKRVLKELPHVFFEEALQALVGEGTLKEEKGGVALDSHSPSLPPELEKARTMLLEELGRSPLSPPPPDRLPEILALPPALVREAISCCRQDGAVVLVAPEMIILSSEVEKAAREVRGFIHQHGAITASQARSLLGSTRKFVIPILEFLDAEKYTRRQGDYRFLGPREV